MVRPSRSVKLVTLTVGIVGVVPRPGAVRIGQAAVRQVVSIEGNVPRRIDDPHQISGAVIIGLGGGGQVVRRKMNRFSRS